MSGYGLTTQANADLYSIWAYLTQNASQRTADSIENELFEAFEMLAEMPGIGHLRDDLTDRDIFFFTVQNYMVIYRKTKPLEILSIIHASRDVAHVLDEREL